MRGSAAVSAGDRRGSRHDAGGAVAPSARRVPGDFPRRALLAVVGTSPQVLTETVHALTQTLAPDERFGRSIAWTQEVAADFARVHIELRR